ncbi:hypothetical protein L1987_84579 [Smallanthus sonchifolius]|uniref:Uncharacterized protein n=1 Tax=Smallanthus sonchifolius TaxID=185202 RepID=A0ACB8XUJ8_9ASTR|nr:hypothetical protein L1987_84579 [Smallanthus sonchifolius]
MRRPRGDTRFRPFLADLRVPEFVRDTAALMDRRAAGSNPSGTESLPIEVEMEISDRNQLREGLTSGSLSMGKDPNNKTGQVLGSTAPSQSVGGPISCIEVPTQAGDIDPSEAEMVSSEIAPGSIHYGMYSPRRDGRGIQSIVWDASNSHYSLNDRQLESDSGNAGNTSIPPPVTQSGLCSVWNSPVSSSTELESNPKGPRVLPVVNSSNDICMDNEGFTVVNRRKKRNGIKVQNKKQKPVVIKSVHQQNKTSQNPTTSGTKVLGLHIGTHSDYARKEVTNQPNTHAQSGMQNGGNRKSKGFDFYRAVNGSAVTVPDGNRPGKSHLLQPSSSSAGMTDAAARVVPIDVDQPSTNLNQQPNLLSVHPSVDTHNNFMVLDFQKSFKYNKLVGDSLDPGMSDQSDPSVMDPDKCNEPQQENLVCQVNREFIEGVRILPNSIVSPPKSYRQSSGQEVSLETLNREEDEVKDYGISDAQKLAITSEHEFFEDQVKAMGLDYDYCVEDVESDDENGTAQFFAAQMKVGMSKVGRDEFNCGPFVLVFTDGSIQKSVQRGTSAQNGFGNSEEYNEDWDGS